MDYGLLTMDYGLLTNRRKFLQGITALSSLSLAGCGWRLADVRAAAGSGRRRVRPSRTGRDSGRQGAGERASKAP